MKASDTITLKRPGRRWDDGLPLGNGRLGLMTPGKVNEETIVVNEETLWYGPARIRRNPDGREQIGEIRRLLMEGSVEKASFLAKMALTSTPKYNNPYQPAGDLRLCFMGHNAPAQEYRRCLLLPEGVALVEYTMNGVRYRREMFVSMAYQVGVIRLTADMSWKNHRLEECLVTALEDCEAEFVYGGERKKKVLRGGERTAVRF